MSIAPVARGLERGLQQLARSKALQQFRRALERAFRGADSSEVISSALRDTIGSPAVGETSASYAMRALGQVEIPSSAEVGGAARYAEGALDPKLSPRDRGEALHQHQVPDLDPETRKFFSSDAVVGPPRKPPSSRFEDPQNPGGAPRGKDIGVVTQFTAPAHALSFHPLARGLYTGWRRARFDAAELIEAQAATVKGITEALEKAKDVKGKTAQLFRAMNAPEGEALSEVMKGLTPKEQASVLSSRQYLNDWIASRPDLQQELSDRVVRRISKNLPERRQPPAARQAMIQSFAEDFQKRGLLERAASLAWKDGDFFFINKQGKPRRGAFPVELSEIAASGNAAFKHLAPNMPVREDVVPPLLSIFSGITRRQIYEPAWREMALASQELPPRLKRYVRQWVKELRGVPTLADELIDDLASEATRKLGFKVPLSPGQKYSTLVLGGLYRGALWGNLNFYFANYFGQGFLNVAAKHGPMAAMYGLAKHITHGAKGVPREALMGGFESIFGKEIPVSGIAGEIGSIPGLRSLRKFFRAVDEFAGPTRTEYINRSIAFHVGLKESLDNFNLANKTKHTIDDVLKPGVIDDEVRHNLMFDALMDSENVNYVYGVDGRSPLMPQILGRPTIAMTTQFLSWAPKTAEFLFGPILRDHDPGLLMNYMLLTGWLSRQLATAWGVDFGPMTLFGARLPTRQFAVLPTGPVGQALQIAMQIPNEEDPFVQRDMWKELGRIVTMGVIPGDLQARKWQNFWRSMQAEGLLTQGPPYELIHEWGPVAAQQPGPMFGAAGGFSQTDSNLVRNFVNIMHSETPARVLGLPMLSDRQERRLVSEVWRAGRQWRFYQQTRVEKLVTLMQTKEGGMESPEFLQLMAEVEQEGIPLGGALREGILSIALPRLLRTLKQAPSLAKPQYLELLKQKYPEIFHPDYNQELDFEPRVLWDQTPDEVLQGKPAQEPQYEELFQ